jgi:hypothetical protein
MEIELGRSTPAAGGLPARSSSAIVSRGGRVRAPHAPIRPRRGVVPPPVSHADTTPDAAALSIHGTRHAGLPALADLEARIEALTATVAELAHTIRAGAIAPIGTPAQAGRILGVGACRIQRMCRAAERAGESVILGNISFRRTGGGDLRPRYGVYLPQCVRQVGGQ